MTTTEIDFALPVSFTLVRQAGNDQLVRADGGGHYRLEGPSVVAASWSGPQKAELWHHHNTGAGFQWRKLAEFNGGGSHGPSRSKTRGESRGVCPSCGDSVGCGRGPQRDAHDLSGLAAGVVV